MQKNECPYCHWGFWNPTVLKKHICEKHADAPPEPEVAYANHLAEAAPDLLAALKAVFLNPKTNQWLAVNDPATLKLMGKAVAKAMNIPVEWKE